MQENPLDLTNQAINAYLVMNMSLFAQRLAQVSQTDSEQLTPEATPQSTPEAASNLLRFTSQPYPLVDSEEVCSQVQIPSSSLSQLQRNFYY